MSQRDRDARAAMREVLRAVLTGDVDGPMSPAEMAQDAWNYADAMAAERAKREAAEAPKETTPCPWRFDCITCGVGIAVDDDRCCKTCGRDAVVIKDGVPDYSMVVAGEESHDDAELAAARREGRDAGLRGMAAECEQAIRDTGGDSDIIPGLRRAIRMTARLAERQPTPAARRPTSADIASEKGGEWAIPVGLPRPGCQHSTATHVEWWEAPKLCGHCGQPSAQCMASAVSAQPDPDAATVERCARSALDGYEGNDPPMYSSDWGQLPEDDRDAWRDVARAVLAAASLPAKGAGR